MTSRVALIVGAGPGLSASLVRACREAGMQPHIAARDGARVAKLAETLSAVGHVCDATDTRSVDAMFAALDKETKCPELVVYNPSARERGPLVELDREGVRRGLEVTAFGGFLVAQAATERMLVAGGGSIFFTGASASVKGYARSASFAMGKFALRGLAQSMARELAPKNIHVAHFIIDGGIRARDAPAGDDERLDPDAIAKTYLDVHAQHRSAWTWELELRPWSERF